MTTFDALVSISQMVLRARNQWHGGTTSHANIDAAVNACADVVRGDDMIGLITFEQINLAIAELKIRAGFEAAAAERFGAPARPQVQKEVA